MNSRPLDIRRISATAALGCLLWIGSSAPVAAGTPWRNYVGNCLDRLLTYGTDRYGAVQSDMLVAILDVNTLTSPQNPPLLDDAYYDGGNNCRSVGGGNFWYDQETIRAMYRMSSMTGDAHYAAGANRTINAFFDHAMRPDTGMPAWGSHMFYNVFTDERAFHTKPTPVCETLIYDAQWGRLYDQRPVEIRAVIDNIWNRSVVHTTGQFNRHDDGPVGCDFAFAGGSYISAFASMYNKTQDPTYLNQALTVENWHWSHRNPSTNLVADAPGLGDSRYDGNHCFTTVTGPYAWQLLNAYEQTGNATFLNHAATYLKAYDQYGWDPVAGTYYAELNLNGTPVPYVPKGDGYDAWEPTGHVDMWKGTLFDYEFPLIAAQSTIRAYQLTGDSALLTASEHWAAAIQQNLPIKIGYRWAEELLAQMPNWAVTGGSYAEDYGRVISFFVSMYEATDDASYLQLAEQVGQDAVDKLYVNGIIRGHAAKPYYEATNGVGILLDAMLELDAVAAPEPGTFTLLVLGLIGLSVYARRRRR